MDAHDSEDLENDVCFILTSAFLIFTMQTGYALLESGTVSRKNEVNILLKNAVNIICGSMAFWAYGFAFSSDHRIDPEVEIAARFNFTAATKLKGSKVKSQKGLAEWSAAGQQQSSSGWSGIWEFALDNIVTPERFFLHIADHRFIGTTYAEMAFQLAYATTCTSIISGAMAERCRFMSFFIFSFIANILFCLPARWTMFNGWLNRAGALDIGGSGTVHLVGGCAGLVGAMLLGPRLGRFDADFRQVPMGHPTNVVHGIILLWWGWLGYSAGSSFGIAGDKWAYASRSSVVTILSSMSGGAFGMIWSAFARNGLQEIHILSNSILASLVAISGGAAVISPTLSILVGIVGAALCLITIPLMEKLRIDDPTSSFAVHAVGGAWGMLATGFFADPESVVHYRRNYEANITVSKAEIENVNATLLYGQLEALAVLIAWSVIVCTIILLPIRAIFGFRMTSQEEILGSDFVEHGIIHDGNRQLLKIVKQKIDFVITDGMTESQASAEVAKRFVESERKRTLRKRSLTGKRSTTSTRSSSDNPAKPLTVHELISKEKFRLQNERYYLNHMDKNANQAREFVESHQPTVHHHQQLHHLQPNPAYPHKHPLEQSFTRRPNTSVGEQAPSIWTIYNERAVRPPTPGMRHLRVSSQTLPTVEDI